MRGVLVLLPAMLSLALTFSARADDAPFDAVDALAKEKVAAVDLLRQRAERQVALAAGDRLFAAYLNAATIGEGQRLQPRIAALLNSLVSRYGIREVAVTDRAGAFLARAGNVDRTIAAQNPETDPLLLAGFAAAPRRTETLQNARGLHLVAPVFYRDRSEYVIDARQDFSSYHAVLSHGLTPDRFVVLTNAKGVILADGGNGATGGTVIVAKLTLDAIRKAAPGGHGEVVASGLRYRVSYRPVGDWIIVAVERAPAPRRCHAEGARLCG